MLFLVLFINQWGCFDTYTLINLIRCCAGVCPDSVLGLCWDNEKPKRRDGSKRGGREGSRGARGISTGIRFHVPFFFRPAIFRNETKRHWNRGRNPESRIKENQNLPVTVFNDFSTAAGRRCRNRVYVPFQSDEADTTRFSTAHSIGIV